MSTLEHPEQPAPKIHYQCYQNIINETLGLRLVQGRGTGRGWGHGPLDP